MERAGAVAGFVELQSVSLAAASVATELDPLALPEAFQLSNRFRARHELRTDNRPHDRPLDRQMLYVSIDFDLEASRTEGGPQTSVVKLSATFQLIYSLREDASYPDGALDDFAQLNGVYNAWPYWRELVQTVTGRVGLAGVVIPVFRPAASRNMVAEGENQPEALDQTED